MGVAGVRIGASLRGLWQPVPAQVLGASQPLVPVSAQVQRGLPSARSRDLQAVPLKVSPAQPPKAESGALQLGEQRSGPARTELPGPQVSTGGRALARRNEVVVFLVQK